MVFTERVGNKANCFVFIVSLWYIYEHGINVLEDTLTPYSVFKTTVQQL